MRVESNFCFFKEVTKPGVPENVYSNFRADLASIQISGDFSSGSFIFEGKTDNNVSEWTPITAISLEDFSASNTAAKKGIYEVSIEGLTQFRVRIASLAGGKATVFGRIICNG